MGLEAGEPIRLVIWDLDETFWRGTLSEGGVKQYVEAHHRIVVDLARRGIVSSICSRNDLAPAREILTQKGLWDYFAFPSIDWSAKPARVKALIEAIQLRAETVLFIDDNPSNRAAVAAANPGLRVAPETFIAEIPGHPLFVGKPDAALTRLKQYKLLEKRDAERSLAADPTEFLRASGIRVEIEVDLEPHFERIVELVNRTNQLNFTKRRLSEDTSVAVRQLKDWLAREAPWVRAGLVRVRDNYGDYGYCGFYAQQGERLEYFCFSCRVLGFGVESFIYARLGRPDIEVVGDVLVDLARAPQVDWIAVERLGETAPAAPLAGQAPTLFLRGRCEVGLLLSYFNFAGYRLTIEGACRAGLWELFSDSAVNMYSTSGSRWTEALPELQRLGFSQSARCRAFDSGQNAPVLFFAHRDFLNRPLLYRRREGALVLCLGLTDYAGDLVSGDPAEIVAHIRAREPDPARAEVEIARLAYLREHYVSVGVSSPTVTPLVARCLRALLEEAPVGALLMAGLLHPYAKDDDGQVQEFVQIRNSREALSEALGDDPRVAFIDASACLRSPDEIADWFHYDRVVYYRMAKLVMDHCGKRQGGTGAAQRPALEGGVSQA